MCDEMMSDGRRFFPPHSFFSETKFCRFYWQMAGADGQLRLSFHIIPSTTTLIGVEYAIFE